MKERTTFVAAGAVALLLVGSLAILSFRRSQAKPLIPTLISQRVVPATAHRSEFIEIKILPPPNRPRPEDPDEDEEPIVYRVVDRQGRVYSNIVSRGGDPVMLVIPTGYGQPAEAPRLVTLVDGQPRGSLNLPPFPRPSLRSLPAREDRRIQAFQGHRDVPGPSNVPRSVIVLRALAPITPDEVWDLRVFETNLAVQTAPPALPARPELSRSAPEGILGLDSVNRESLFQTDYAEDATALRVSVFRRRHRIRTEDVVVPGLRIVKRNDRTYFILPHPVDVANHLGLRLTIAEPTPNPSPSDRPLSPSLKFDTHGTNSWIGFSPPTNRSTPHVARWMPQGAVPELGIFLLGPRPADLGLSSILLGPTSLVPEQALTAPRPPRKEPFDLRLRLSYEDWVPVGRFEATIPIEREDPQKRGRP